MIGKISIIIPVYNVASYLNQCIYSVLNQTYTDYEIILIDDGSTDKSGFMCDQYAQNNDKILVIHQNNQGLSMARNNGVQRASGEYIVFLDSDDYWNDNDVLYKMVSRLNRTNSDVLSFNYVKTDGVNVSNPYFLSKDSMPVELNVNDTFNYQIENDLWIACAWNKVIKRSLFDDYDLYFRSGVTSEDIDWCVRLALCAENFDFLTEEIVCYRQRETSISKSMSFKKVQTLFDNIDLCLKLISDNNENPKSELLKSYIGYQYGTALFSIALLVDKSEREELIKRAKKNTDLLKWSKNKKVKLLNLVNMFGGLNVVITLLRLRNKL